MIYSEAEVIPDHPPEAILAQHHEPEMTGWEVYFIHELIVMFY